MAEWLYEAGIGENRAILVEDGAIVAAQVERPETGVRAGTIAEARLVDTGGGLAGLVRLADGTEAVLTRLPRGVATGGPLMVEIVREAIPEPGKLKRAVAAPAPDAAARCGPGLLERLDLHPARRCVAQLADDPFEQHGWSELLDEAGSGEIAFPGGALRVSLTPAMTLIDVDGDAGDPLALARAGTIAAGRAINRFDLTGSIGIDLPTVTDRKARLALADAIDALLPQPFERTAVNGFGFLQIVRRRVRASLAELIRHRPVESAALALLRRAERARGTGPAVLAASPAVAQWLRPRSCLLDELARRLGRPVELAESADEGQDGGHVT